MPTPHLDAIGLVADDLPTTLAFYRRLGLVFPADAEAQGHVEATLPGGLRLMFDTVAVVESFSKWSPPAGGRRVALAFACATPAEVDAVYAELVAAGAPSLNEPWDAFWGQRYARVQDPDGNPVDLFAALPDAGS